MLMRSSHNTTRSIEMSMTIRLYRIRRALRRFVYAAVFLFPYQKSIAMFNLELLGHRYKKYR